MEQRALGPFRVAEVGLGAGPLGSDVVDDAAVERLIHGAIDLGVNLIDTAPSYGRSERRIGAALRGRRDRVVLSTKLGYGVPGVPDWTGPCITRGVDAALARLETDWLDLAHLHSCGQDVLERGDVIEALARAVHAGKVRVAAYSGDNAPLAWAIASGRFGVIQCSVSVVDQRALDANIPAANERGVGVLAKRPLANGVWREPARPRAPDRGEYWDRLHAMEVAVASRDSLPASSAAEGRRGSIDPARLLRFTLGQPIACALVGTTQLANVQAAVTAAEQGPLPDADELRATFQRCDRGWDGIV